LAVPAPVLVLSGLNALACTVLPVLAVMMAIERIGASMTAQIGMVGPLSTIAMGAALLGETFSVWTAAGTALVLVGVTLLARMAPR
jgi:drug/metabolite transporter (DMT)-like permease